eukprot:CAMPEP_0117572704 /NCGR_PEP_ID=MMETSP0784-20121206/60502_1 /TAXON_ID=39447 /ORGANISM="" /LENGTH=55 /DNA_ID=CAMNT_0005371099 /DNA_START=139 /DNA_END=303 /DNA_ORIENTATION=+
MAKARVLCSHARCDDVAQSQKCACIAEKACNLQKPEVASGLKGCGFMRNPQHVAA